MANNTKRGRPRDKAKIVYSPVDGTILPYAKIDAQGNRFFSWKDEKGVWKKKNLGRGKKWYNRYLQYEAQYIKKEPYVVLPEITIPIVSDDEIDDENDVEEFELTIENGKGQVTKITPRFQLSIMVKWAKDIIHNNPERASKLFEIPYERLIGLAPKKNYTLQEIGSQYFNKIEFKGKLKTSQNSELKKVRRTWDRFCKVVGVKTILEIKKELINKYYDNIYQEYKKKWSTTWMGGHFERVKRVINNACRELDHSEDIIEARRLCLNKLKCKENIVQKPPYRIKKKEFKKLLEVSSIEERAMWMLSMNCAYYSVDVATVPLSAFDWEENTVVFKRGKMKKKGMGNRASVLWDITIDAINKYLEETKHRKRQTLFVSNQGLPYVENRIRKKFVAVRKKINLGHIEHRNFRDSFESIGQKVRGIQNSVDAVMGHIPNGSRGDYIDPELVPEIAEDACKAVYDYYFC